MMYQIHSLFVEIVCALGQTSYAHPPQQKEVNMLQPECSERDGLNFQAILMRLGAHYAFYSWCKRPIMDR